VGVEPDTTMRARPQLRSTQNRQRRAESYPAPQIAIPVARIFDPATLDLDDLAEAIRSLLASSETPHITSPGRPNSDLLSFPRRGTHVVEANDTP
jgi:hypothetical protein